MTRSRSPHRVARCRTALCGGAVTLLVASSGCSSTPDVNGAVGITVAGGGDPVAIVQLCSGVADTITVSGPNRGSQPNEVHAELSAAPVVRRTTAVDLVSPGEAWRGRALTLPLDDELYVVVAASRSHNSELTQAEFTVAELSALTPDTVQYSEYGNDGLRSVVVARSRFADTACKGRN